jgi:5-methylcytosine-specific restriction endonuclease McrA
MALQRPLESVLDDDLISGLADIAGQARRVEADLVAHIAEVDFRRLYARYACPSMFVYATRVLHLAEGEAFRRIRVARASRRHPLLLEMLADGRLHVSGIALLVPILTTENCDRLVSLAIHKTKREIEKLVAEVCPRPDVPSVMRKLPERSAAPICGEPRSATPVELVPGTALESAPALPSLPRPVSTSVPVVEPLAPERYKIQFTAGEDLHEDLERLRALLRSEIPDGDLGAIVGKAVRELRRRLEARRFAQTNAPRKTSVPVEATPSSRYVPAAIRRTVYERDGGQCRFLDPQGTRCPERHYLEYHHRYPFGLGGGHDLDNIRLMCEPHNRYLAEIDYGKEAIGRHIDRRMRARASGGREDEEPTVPGTSAGSDGIPVTQRSVGS